LSRAWRRAAALAAATVFVALVPIGAGALPAASAAPASPDLGAAIERYPAYEAENTCDPTEKPGPVAVRGLIKGAYGSTQYVSITRPCSGTGSSGHHSGRAVDWMRNAGLPDQKAQADDFIAWLLATDRYGNAHANARRLGVSYIIWNTQMFRLYDAARGWQPYTGSSPHTDHVHISFTWAGAWARTSFFTGAPLWGMSADRTEIEAFIDAAYDDFVGAPPSSTVRSAWVAKFRSGAMDRYSFGYELARTVEYVTSVVDKFYRDTLGREADAEGAAFWRAALLAGMTEAQVGAGFYGSAEYVIVSGGTPEAWMTALYRALLLREPDAAGLAHWAAAAQAFGSGALAETFYQSLESRQLRTKALYERFLDRGVDPSGLASWPAVLLAQGDLRLAAFLASSDEYLSRALAAQEAAAA
jgi:hypothetical protein